MSNILELKKVFTEIFGEIEKRINLKEIRSVEFIEFWEATSKSFPKCLPYWVCIIILEDMSVQRFTVKEMKEE